MVERDHLQASAIFSSATKSATSLFTPIYQCITTLKRKGQANHFALSLAGCFHRTEGTKNLLRY